MPDAPPTLAPLHAWLTRAPDAAVANALDRLRRTEGVVHIAVMPDVHVASEFCVGTVVGTRDLLFPMAVGGDIGCGLLALRFDAPADLLRDRTRAARLLSALYEVCPARRHHRRLAPTMPPDLGDPSAPQLAALLRGDARLQLGTLGAGNHFLEFQADKSTDALWLMIHTGSRNLGQMVLHHHLPRCRKTATGLWAMDAASEAGDAYLADVTLARRYAAANRRALALAAAGALESLFGVSPVLETLYDCDHNHVQREAHPGGPMLVHRKGASYAADGVCGIIPGSMASESFHTIGRGLEAALCSSSHGAGRALSRTQAREKITASALRQQLHGLWYDHRLTPHLREEAPAAYKPIREVMAAQADLVRIERVLHPLLCYKGV